MTDTDTPVLEESVLPKSVKRKPAKADLTVDPFEALLNRPPSSTKVVLAVDPNDAVKFSELRATLLARRNALSRTPTDVDRKMAVDQAQRAHDEFIKNTETVTFHFRSIGHDKMDELINAWPATAEQIAKHREASGDAKAMLAWDLDNYPPRFFAATCFKAEFTNGTVVDGFTEDQALSLWAQWDEADLNELLTGALAANQRSSKIESLGKS